MRLVVVSALTALVLAACGPSQPSASPTPAAAPAAQPAPPSTPESAAAPKAPPPEGDCGDQSRVPADQRIANTARWTTASEEDTFGYDVFRGDTEKGEFKKVTPMPIMGAGTSDETHKYEYRDDTIDPCKDYWYYVEETSTKGEHHKITPTFHAAAKRRARGTPAETSAH